MTLAQGVAAFVLWRHGKFSTYDIASLLGLEEHEVYLALHVAREAERARADARC